VQVEVDALRAGVDGVGEEAAADRLRLPVAGQEVLDQRNARRVDERRGEDDPVVDRDLVEVEGEERPRAA
jgi:hypothetical protein